MAQSNKPHGRLWYGWQYTKGFFKALGSDDDTARLESRAMARNIAIGIGAAAAISTIGGYVPIPFTGWIFSGASLLGGGFFGYRAFNNGQVLKSSRMMKSYISTQENKPPLKQRIGNALRRTGQRVLLGLSTAARWTGFAGLAAGTGAAGITAASFYTAWLPTGFAGAVQSTVVAGGAALGLSAAAAAPVALGAVAVGMIATGIGIKVAKNKANKIKQKLAEDSGASYTAPAPAPLAANQNSPASPQQEFRSAVQAEAAKKRRAARAARLKKSNNNTP
ncbi:MAG: hypothetical protein OXT65_11340 [Alphaproteobacteria bacterium]|nr:hypothetical protein [Alphaproteobacteria bacterium]